MKLDILAFGAHPDDIELACAGTLMKSIDEGKKVGIIDLTRGELGTRGDADTRTAEAAAAAKVMGVHLRENLNLKDAFFMNDEDTLKKIVTVIRKYKPVIVLCNAPQDRHPDHGKSAKLIADAAFLSGLRKIETFDGSIQQEAWKPSYVFNYLQDQYLQPTFLVDVSCYQDRKIEAILCYKSQFFNPENSGEPQTYISSPIFLEALKGKEAGFGKQVGVGYAEGFISQKLLAISSLETIVANPT